MNRPSLQLSDRDTARARRRKRRTACPCVFAVLAAAAKSLNAACRRCPRCGHTSAHTRFILGGAVCERCGYTVFDT